ncbi:hypothetical protein J6P04_03390 [bacterium]|nr:hypothetical protein [bacterium]
MKNNKKKIWKIVGATFGVAAICCIIPACVVSCGSSSTPTSNIITGNNLVGTNVSSNTATVTQSSFNQMMQSIDGQGLSSQDSSEMNSVYSI